MRINNFVPFYYRICLTDKNYRETEHSMKDQATSKSEYKYPARTSETKYRFHRITKEKRQKERRTSSTPSVPPSHSHRGAQG